MKTIKTSFTIFAALFLLNSANAQTLKSDKTEDNFSVKYTGIEDNYLCFQVEVTGTGNSSFLKISDKSEGELYSQKLKLNAPFQIFKIEKRDGQQIIFNVQNGNKEFNKVFSATTKLVENTVVSEDGVAIL